MTLTGSAVAFGKLHGVLGSAPLNLPGKNVANLGMAAGTVASGAAFLSTGDPAVGLARPPSTPLSHIQHDPSPHTWKLRTHKADPCTSFWRQSLCSPWRHSMPM